MIHAARPPPGQESVLLVIYPQPGPEPSWPGWAVWMGDKIAETLASRRILRPVTGQKPVSSRGCGWGKTMSDKQILLLAILLGSQGAESAAPEKQIPANLTIKVASRRLRDHWVAEARREGGSLTRVVTQFLLARYGSPRD